MKQTRILFIALTLLVSLKARSGTDMDLNGGWLISEAGKDQWIKGYVPGNIYLDLFAAGKIPDPKQNDNYRLCQWVESREWEYKRSFQAEPAKDIGRQVDELEFKGLDTYADVYLNNYLILHGDNAFRTYTINVTGLLKSGNNEIRILFHPADAIAGKKSKAVKIRYPADNDSLSPFVRKPALQFGWDFAPRLVSCGISGGVWLHSWEGYTLRDAVVQNKIVDSSSAKLSLRLQLESLAMDTVDIQFGNYFHVKRVVFKGLNTLELPFTIKNPQLWWPNGYGNQQLYKEKLVLKNKSNSINKELKFGIRSLELVQEKDSIGTSFYFRVNGKAIYAKGVNLVPFALMSNIKELGQLFNKPGIGDAGYNMIRVWGGGSYGDDKLYDFADEKGLLVWQDFMFSGTLYPGDTAFLNSVSKEAEDNILRIRNHPSLALWCGNNEVEVAWKNWGWQKKFNYSKEDTALLMRDYNKLFKQILPDKVKELDPGRAYISSSPISNWGKAEDFKSGDNHYWGVWHGEQPFEEYKNHVPRFMSEFGFQSFPEMNSIAHFTSGKDLSIDSPVLKAHQFSYKGNGLIGKYMDMYYNKPKDFESLVYLSQVLQADGMKTAIEAQRRSMPYCMGSLVWQLNDYWPCASWSLADSYGQPKAAAYAVRNAFAPVLLSPVVKENQLDIYCVTDQTSLKEVELSVHLFSVSGKSLMVFNRSKILKSNQSEVILSRILRSKGTKKGSGAGGHGLLDGYDASALCMYVCLTNGKDTIASTIHYFVDPKELKLQKPAIDFVLMPAPGVNTYRMVLRSPVLAKDVCISAPDGVLSDLSDNYFDLLPGMKKIIEFKSAKTPDEIRASVNIRTLYDTYTHE